MDGKYIVAKSDTVVHDSYLEALEQSFNQTGLTLYKVVPVKPGKRKRVQPTPVLKGGSDFSFDDLDDTEESEPEEIAPPLKRTRPLTSLPKEAVHVYLHSKRISWTRKVGICVHFGEDDPRNVLKVVPKCNVDYHGLLFAVIEVLKVITSDQKVIIYTPDEELIKQVNRYMPRWARNGWEKASGDSIPWKHTFQKIHQMTEDGQLNYKLKRMPSSDPTMHKVMQQADDIAKAK